MIVAPAMLTNRVVVLGLSTINRMLAHARTDAGLFKESEPMAGQP